jgi:hypothetical protein
MAFPDDGGHTLRIILKTAWRENRWRVRHQVRWVGVNDPHDMDPPQSGPRSNLGDESATFPNLG